MQTTGLIVAAVACLTGVSVQLNPRLSLPVHVVQQRMAVEAVECEVFAPPRHVGDHFPWKQPQGVAVRACAPHRRDLMNDAAKVVAPWPDDGARELQGACE